MTIPSIDGLVFCVADAYKNRLLLLDENRLSVRYHASEYVALPLLNFYKLLEEKSFYEHKKV